jgi:uncharacterized protein (DUF1778 family)
MTKKRKPGRPKGITADKIISISISSKSLQIIDRGRQIEGKSRSAFMTDCAVKAATDLILHPNKRLMKALEKID